MSDAEAAALDGQAGKDKLFGKAKDAIGNAVGADELAAKGRLQQAEGDAKSEAAELAVQAAAQRRAAAQEYVEGTREASAERIAAVTDEQRRDLELEQERARARAAADRAVDAREAAVDRVTDARESAIDAVEDDVLDDRRKALDDVDELSEQAARARDNARELDALADDART